MHSAPKILALTTPAVAETTRVGPSIARSAVPWQSRRHDGVIAANEPHGTSLPRFIRTDEIPTLSLDGGRLGRGPRTVNTS